MSIVRKRVVISGRVQGVAFRAYTKRAAAKVNATGWVRNLPDGNVEAVFEGSQEAVSSLLLWCKKGSPFGRVDQVTVYDESPTGEFRDFRIGSTPWS